MIDRNEPVQQHRHRLALALDTDDLVVAQRLAADLGPWFGVARIGLELYSAVGPEAVASLRALGYEVFVDLKLHDTPEAVNAAARVMGSLGVKYLTMHAHGGVEMLSAGVEGLKAGAEAAGLPEPVALGVTVLSGDEDAPPHIVPKRVRIAVEGGCGGLVCAADALRDVHELAPRLLRVTPGTRPVSATRPMPDYAVTPRQAIDAGADLLVIGRAVTEAANPMEAASGLFRDLVSVPDQASH